MFFKGFLRCSCFFFSKDFPGFAFLVTLYFGLTKVPFWEYVFFFIFLGFLSKSKVCKFPVMFLGHLKKGQAGTIFFSYASAAFLANEKHVLVALEFGALV